MDVLPWQHAVNRSGLSVFLQLGGGGSPPRRAIVTPDVPLVMNRDKESVYWVGMSRRRWGGSTGTRAYLNRLANISPLPSFCCCFFSPSPASHFSLSRSFAKLGRLTSN